jgi:membrane protein YdbS with pleckstrin-like domain
MDEAAAWQTLHPNSVAAEQRAGMILTAAIAFVSLVGVVISMFAGDMPGWLMILFLAAWLGMVTALAWLAWFMPIRRFRYTRYRVDTLGLVIHRGRIFHSELGVPRSRIQHTDVTQGPIQRLYGIATLSIFTAGTEDAKIDLSGLEFETARQLRAELTGQASDDVV